MGFYRNYPLKSYVSTLVSSVMYGSPLPKRMFPFIDSGEITEINNKLG